MKDLLTREDIVLLVDTFYDHVKKDNVLGPKFSHVDWPKHLPIMYSFWSSMMLGEQSYRGNPFQSHMHLDLQVEHFESWINLFYETVDQLFHGSQTDEIKIRARNISEVWKMKLRLSPITSKS